MYSVVQFFFIRYLSGHTTSSFKRLIGEASNIKFISNDSFLDHKSCICDLIEYLCGLQWSYVTLYSSLQMISFTHF